MVLRWKDYKKPIEILAVLKSANITEKSVNFTEGSVKVIE